MMFCRGHLQRPDMKVYWAGLSRLPCGGRSLTPRHRLIHSEALWRSGQKGVNGFSRWRWRVLSLVLGREGKGEVLQQAREVSRYLLRTVARQSEVHASQKLRRALQLYSAYTRLWGEEAARSMLACLRRVLASKGRHLLLSAVCFSNLNWEEEKISENRLQESMKDLRSVVDLCHATVECHTCGKRQIIDQKMVDVDYCVCGGTPRYTDETREYESWRPFIERKNHIVWRKPHHIHNHLFAYKVYGRYDDVSLSSFMEAQLNCTYRTEWDDSALQLRVLDSHPDSNSDLVYWLVKFPTFFANRDYLFKRRFTVDNETKQVVIMSEAACSDIVPEEGGIHRVNEYWSTMVIRALGDVDQPGIEYTLTYFDNPGTSLPQSITNFIAVTAFPNFLKKLHQAALHLQSSHEKGEDVYVNLPAILRYPRQHRREVMKLPEYGVPSEEELEALPKGEEIQVMDSSIETLIEEDLPGESQEEGHEDISLPTVSVFVEDLSSDHELTEEKHTPDLISSIRDTVEAHVENSSVSETSTTSSEVVEATSKEKASDKSFQVNIGGRRISVDLLEAMEVVAPDLEKKSLLVRKIEELNERLQGSNGGRSIILQEVWKLRHKLKSFHEKASMRKEESMKQMEQLSKRDHYHHMNVDDKTLTQLEMLFEAMKYVLKADKDMRTGKTLLDRSTTSRPKAKVEDDEFDGSQSADKPRPFHFNVGKDGDDQPSHVDQVSNTAKSKATKKMKKKKRSQPPRDPPPPDSPKEEWDKEGETTENPESFNRETGNFANELDNIANSVHDIDGKASENRSWFTGFSVPYISAWWEATPRQVDNSPISKQDDERPEANEIPNPDTQSNVLLSQIYHVLTLRWMFSSSRDETVLPGEEKTVNVKITQHGQEELKGDEESESVSSDSWYWYPVSGVYRVYAWIFSASRMSA